MSAHDMSLHARPTPPIAMLRALPPGPLARQYQHLERARRLAPLFAAFDRDDMETAVDMLLAEMDAADGDPDVEDDDLGASVMRYSDDDDVGADPLLDFDEPALPAAPDGLPGDPDDAEDSDEDREHDGREPGEDDEPDHDGEHSLGAPEHYAGNWRGEMGHGGDVEVDEDGGKLVRQHRDRIRRTRCDRFVIRGHGWEDVRYQLRHGGGQVFA